MSPGYLCPRYDRCGASFCPGGLGGTHLAGERACCYLLEAVKTGGSARVEASIPRELAEAVLDQAQRLISRQGPLPRELRRASKHGSKVEQGRQAIQKLRTRVTA